MAHRLGLPGAARLSTRGEFEVYLGGNKDRHGRKLPQFPIDCSATREMIREYYEFLMSDEMVTRIGTEIVKKMTTSKTNRQYVRMPIMNNYAFVLYRIRGQFAVLIQELPFLVMEEGDENSLIEDQVEVYEEEEEEEEAYYGG